MTDALLLLTHCPDDACAERIALALLDARLAACVNIGAPVRSLYHWQGALERAAEVPLAIKTTRARLAECMQALRALHPYEVPEVVALPIEAGHAPYLRWIDEATRPPLIA